ncbi:hypothetical protein B9Z19DRAFT_1127128 [Tuber borchii]|uniref:Uncharacterized protein n=1 Tax=Tuber borchii TaxID=42251 RepID=A0A2T6ZRZ0_TUBBO|nr:hypothetical protein B9Z19DRAFT_1127128 [Tuber borchii]
MTKQLRTQFKSLLTQLPVNAVLFILINGITYFECADYWKDAYLVIERLHKIAQGANMLIKTLVIAPSKSQYMVKKSESEMGRRPKRKSSQMQEGGGSDKQLTNPRPKKQRTLSDKSKLEMEKKQRDSEAANLGPENEDGAGPQWKAYLEEAGLYNPNKTTPYQFEREQLRNIGGNTRHQGGRIFCHIAIPNFDLRSVVAGSKKKQPPEAGNCNFEAANEDTLQLITNQNIIIYDCTGNGDVKKGEIMAIKVGAKMKPNPRKDDTAIPDELLSSLTTGLYRFLATEPKTTNDNTRHKSGRNVRRECGPAIPIPNRAKVVASTTPGARKLATQGHFREVPDSPTIIPIYIHAYSTGRPDQSIGRIELSRQPSEMWYGSRDTEKHLVAYLGCIRPLTQLTEKIFQFVVPEVFNKYKLVWDELKAGALGDNVKRSFGIWTSRKIVLCTATDVQLDLLHVPLGYCAIIPLGKFTDGHICLPSLGIKLELQPGESSLS